MPEHWHHIPFLRFLLPLVCGVLIALQFHECYWWIYGLFFVLFIAYLLIGIVTGWTVKFRSQTLVAFLLQGMFLSAGMALVQYQTPWYRSDYFMRDADSSTVFLCRLQKPPSIGEHSIKLEMLVEGKWQQDKYSSASGKTMIYVRRDSTKMDLPVYGDYALIENCFKSPDPPKNPNTFDFPKYLRGIGIAHIARVDASQLVFTGERHQKLWWTFIFRAREMFHDAVMREVKNGDAQSVGEALVIGTKTAIDPEVQQAYANTGTMHVLAVSGLHVGILFAVLEFLLNPISWFKRNKYGRVSKFLFIITIIWWYACLTGLSASVNRSAVMFTCLATGKLFSRQNNSFNVLFVSMFLLLVDDARCITQVGFQLSYLAVGGILFFQPYLQKLWRPKWKILNHIWTMTTVSVAAQISTSPISLFYFHQFPNYFLLSNMLAIPISFVVLVWGLIFFVVNGIPFLGPATGMALDYSLRLLNGSVMAVNQMPGAVINNIYINEWQLGILYVFVLLLGIALLSKQTMYLFRAAFCLCIVWMLAVFRDVKAREDRRLVAYSIRDHDCMLLQGAGDAILLSDTLIDQNSSIWTLNIRNDALKSGVMPDFALFSLQEPFNGASNVLYGYPWLIGGGKVVFLLDPTSVHQLPKSAPEADWVYILGNPFINLPDLQSRFPNATFVIGGSTSYKRHSYYLNTCKKLQIPVHSLRFDGALVLE